jgi:hypothetical protein
VQEHALLDYFEDDEYLKQVLLLLLLLPLLYCSFTTIFTTALDYFEDNENVKPLFSLYSASIKPLLSLQNYKPLTN